MISTKNKLLLWLILSGLMVIIMVFVGGWTRLADAGLSITEWKPVMGIFPPMNDVEWGVEFEKYQSSPEFQKLHNHFTLSDFKQIFWLEFIHRILGRITGMIILIPALFFGYKGYLRSWKPYVAMVALVGFQGFMGWWMVKSGLVDNPHVSHFRLAAHLVTALVLYSVIFWEGLVVCCGSVIQERVVILGLTLDPVFNFKNWVPAHPWMTRWFSLATFFPSTILLLLFFQIFLGALVAGLDAGMIYNTFPMMGNHFVPSEFELSWSAFYDPASVQFMHRCFAYIVAIVIFKLAYQMRKTHVILAIALSVAMIGQILLGIFTIIYVVPMNLALAHQLFAVLLLSLVLYSIFIRRGNYE